MSTPRQGGGRQDEHGCAVLLGAAAFPYHRILNGLMISGIALLLVACDQVPSSSDASLKSADSNQTAQSETAPDYKHGPLAKLGQSLTDLYHAHQAYLEAGGEGIDGFQPADPTIRVIDGRVTIDAVASGDTTALQRDLEAAGMTQAASAGSMVSGSLPIEALDEVAGFETLQFARPSRAY